MHSYGKMSRLLLYCTSIIFTLVVLAIPVPAQTGRESGSTKSISGIWDKHSGPSQTWDPKDFTMRFIEDRDTVLWGQVATGNPNAWVGRTRVGTRQGNIILTTWGGACGYGPNALTAGQERDDIPLRLIISDDGNKMTWQDRKFNCDNNGRLTVTEEWSSISVWDKPWTLYRQAEAQSRPFMNGSFEDGPNPGRFRTLGPGSMDISSWAVTKGTIDYIGTEWRCPCGQRCIDLDGTPGPGAISQTFSTVPGQQYHVSFILWGNSGCDRGLKTVLVKVAGERPRFNFDTSNPAPWVTQNFSFTANSESTTIEFESIDPVGNCGPAIDNVQVTTEPAPAGCPGASNVSKLLFVRQSSAGFEPIKELVYNQPFYIEAHFDVPPAETRKEIKLEWAGQNRGIVVTKQKDPKVFRSEIQFIKKPK